MAGLTSFLRRGLGNGANGGARGIGSQEAKMAEETVYDFALCHEGKHLLVGGGKISCMCVKREAIDDFVLRLAAEGVIDLDVLLKRHKEALEQRRLEANTLYRRKATETVADAPKGTVHDLIQQVFKQLEAEFCLETGSLAPMVAWDPLSMSHRHPTRIIRLDEHERAGCRGDVIQFEYDEGVSFYIFMGLLTAGQQRTAWIRRTLAPMR